MSAGGEGAGLEGYSTEANLYMNTRVFPRTQIHSHCQGSTTMMTTTTDVSLDRSRLGSFIK